jgi:hypothetical protein
MRPTPCTTSAQKSPHVLRIAHMYQPHGTRLEAWIPDVFMRRAKDHPQRICAVQVDDG